MFYRLLQNTTNSIFHILYSILTYNNTLFKSQCLVIILVGISQTCISDMFIWILCQLFLQEIYFCWWEKSIWAAQNANTMHYNCCYAYINKKIVFFYFHWIFVTIQKHLALVLRCTHHTSFFRHPLKRILDQLQVFLFLFPYFISYSYFFDNPEKGNKYMCIVDCISI